MLCIVTDVLMEPCVVYVVGVVIGEREVRVAHHFLARIGEDSAVDASSAFLWLFLEGEERGGLQLEGSVMGTPEIHEP